MKFLILRFSSIGDIVLTTPVIRCLRKKFPEAEIHYAVKKGFSSILESNPYINKIHPLDSSLMELVNALKKEKFDYVIDLHHNQRTSVIKFLLGIKSFSFNKLNLEKWLMVNFKINRLPQMHIVDRYLETVKAIGVESDGQGLDYFLAERDEIDLRTLPAVFHNGYIGWVIGAKQNTKKFPAEKIIEVIRQINFPIVLLGGIKDKEVGENIIAALSAQVPLPSASGLAIFNAAGKYSLNQSASLIRQAKLVVTNDTGLMHIAAAFRKPIISLWGNTIPEFGMTPYFAQPEIAPLTNGIANKLNGIPDVKFQISNLECRPCSKLGYDQCPKGHFNCMNLLNEMEIADAIKKIISLN